MISHIVDINFGELDVILAVFWRTIARFLLGEAKRLRRAGFDEGEFASLACSFIFDPKELILLFSSNSAEASMREVDVEVLLLSMRRMGEVWAIAFVLLFPPPSSRSHKLTPLRFILFLLASPVTLKHQLSRPFRSSTSRMETRTGRVRSFGS